jgi:hypothetical protein
MKVIRSLIWIVVCVLFGVLCNTGLGNEEMKKIVIESKIGVGFGKVVKVEGQIKTGGALGLRSKADEMRLFLRITDLEGKKIEPVILIFTVSPEIKRQLRGGPVRLWGYESVEASGIPIGEFSLAEMPSGAGWAVYSIFVITKVETAASE